MHVGVPLLGTVCLKCQYDRIWNYLGDTLLGVSMRLFSERFN